MAYWNRLSSLGIRGLQNKSLAKYAVRSFQTNGIQLAKKYKKVSKNVPKRVSLSSFISVANLANQLGKRFNDLSKSLESLGFDKNQIGHDYILDNETATLIAEEFGYEVETQSQEKLDEKWDVFPQNFDGGKFVIKHRPPIVTIMGHVDHGKTTILDYLRKSSVVDQEFGGITQHIGAFSVVTPISKKTVTFLDTPGHAAFLKMRQRGADITDIVVLVVAADDSVKPQTIEAIKHCKKSQVNLIVAINKCDKPDANPAKVLADLSSHEIYTESYGGDIQAITVSGKTGLNMDKLEESIVALAEILDLKAPFTNCNVEGHVIESQVKKGVGNVATVLVTAGSLKTGSFLVAGTCWCKVKALKNEFNKPVKIASPSTPVEVHGWKELPEAGDLVLQVENETKAKSVVDYRLEKNKISAQVKELDRINKSRLNQKLALEREEQLKEWLKHGLSAEDLKKKEAEVFGEQEKVIEQTKVPFIIKGDVSGSCEAVKESICNIGNEEVKAEILYSEVGSPSATDLDRAETAGATILCFNVKVPKDIGLQASQKGVEIQEYSVIYYLIENVIKLVSSKLKPKIETSVKGEGEVRAIFSITNTKTKRKFKIAGCRISSGIIERNDKVLVKRGDLIVFKGALNGIKVAKDDVSSIRKDNDCGIYFNNWEDFQEGDTIQAYEEKEVPRYL